MKHLPTTGHTTTPTSPVTGAIPGASAITKTRGLAATDGFCRATASQGSRVLTWKTPTPGQRQTIRATRTSNSPEPAPGIQVENSRPSPIKPHSTNHIQVTYHTGYTNTEAANYPAEFSRQLSRQYEALSYITINNYLTYRTQTTRAKTPKEINDAKDALEKAVTNNLTKRHGGLVRIGGCSS